MDLKYCLENFEELWFKHWQCIVLELKLCIYYTISYFNLQYLESCANFQAFCYLKFSGTIRVWDLTSQSSLLRLVTSPTIVLLPFHISTAHNDSVMCIQWSPHVTDKFASSSRDRSFAMWNLKNRHFPMYKSPSQMSLSLYWLPFNFCVLQGMDDCYT